MNEQDPTIRQVWRAYEAHFGKRFQGLRASDSMDELIKALGRKKAYALANSQSNEDQD